MTIKLFNAELTGSDLCHRRYHCRECQAEDTSCECIVSNSPRYSCTSRRLTKGVVDAHSPCHTLLTLNGGEHLGGVLEGHRTFS
jgi:hypothetical protein